MACVDLFDLSRSRIANANGFLLTSDGPRYADLSLGEQVNMEAQLEHWRYSIASLRSAIRSGTVRELTEKSSLSSPRSVERLRRHDTLTSSNNGRSNLTAVDTSGRKMRYNSPISRQDRLANDWRKRISDSHTPPSHQEQILILLPCSATKPYRLSQSHHRFLREYTQQ